MIHDCYIKSSDQSWIGKSGLFHAYRLSLNVLAKGLSTRGACGSVGMRLEEADNDVSATLSSSADVAFGACIAFVCVRWSMA